jgi:large-conductance mechanosensitive channel
MQLATTVIIGSTAFLKLLKSVMLDLEDPKVVSMIQSVAICYFKITGPYWDVMTSGDFDYLNIHVYRVLD